MRALPCTRPTTSLARDHGDERQTLREARGKLQRPPPPPTHDDHVAASLGSPQVSAAKVIVYKQPQPGGGRPAGLPVPTRPCVGRQRGQTRPGGALRGATLVGSQILRSQISESESAGEVASATGAIQFNKPEVAGDGKPARADPRPQTLHFLHSQVATGSPGSIPQPTTRGSPGRGVVFPAAACRAFSAPAGSPPGRGLPKPEPPPSPRPPEMRSPFSGEGTSRGARSPPLPREPDRSFQAAGTPGERKPDRSLSPRGQKVERRVERRARRAQETLRGLELTRRHSRAEGQSRESRI